MARRFQTGDSIVFPIPAALQVDGGPLTVLVVCKINTSAYQALVYTRSSGAHGWWLEVDTTGSIHVNYGTGTTPRNIGATATTDWRIVTGRKDNGGSVAPIGRQLSGASFATDSGDTTAGSTLVDGTPADGTFGLEWGRWGNTGSDYSDDVEIAFTAIWTSVVSGATLATLTTEALILAASPTYWASFKGSSIVDSAGGTPVDTGTVSTSDPSGFFGGTTVTGTMSATFTGFSATMAGKVRGYGTMAATFGALSGTMVGRVRGYGTMSATLGALSATMVGRVRSYGTMAATFTGFTATMLVPAPGVVNGTMSATFTGFSASMAGRVRGYGTMAATFPGFTATMVVPSGDVVTGTMAATFAGFTARMRVRTGRRVALAPGAYERPHLSVGPDRAWGVRAG